MPNREYGPHTPNDILKAENLYSTFVEAQNSRGSSDLPDGVISYNDFFSNFVINMHTGKRHGDDIKETKLHA